MRCSLNDPLVWLYPDSQVGQRPKRHFRLDVARGGTAAVMVLINDATVGQSITVALDPAPSAWSCYRMIDVPVDANTGPDAFIESNGRVNQFVTRRAPFRVYDAMEPVAASFKASAETQAIRIHIPIPTDARPGVRNYICTITHGGQSERLKLTVTVHRVALPPVGAQSWPYTNWFSFDNMADRHGLEPWSEGHWSMIRRYARLMAYGRQNTFWIPLATIFDFTGAAPQLNVARLRRIVRTFTSAGLHYIEGGHFGGRTDGKWSSPTFSIVGTNHLATSPAGNADIASMARQLMTEIHANGWADRYIQHVTDEPTGDNASDYRIFVGMVRKYMPGIPILDATMDPSLAGSVDIWCPQVHHYQHDRERFEQMRILGDRVWFYTCCSPGGPWLNRLLDNELLRPALFGWAAARYNLDGFLHWALNQYQSDQDPFNKTIIPNWGGGNNSLPAGDTHIVYPGKNGPWSSARFEAQREGLEDLELLRRLRAKNPKRAETLIKPVLRAFDDYTRDPAILRAARRKLMQSVAR